MKLEEKQLLLKRRNILSHWNDKEWWYTGFYDKRNDIYFSFSFIRVNIVDSFTLTIFDKKNLTPEKFSIKFYLDSTIVEDKLCLNYHSKHLIIEYNGDEINGWDFYFKNKDYDIQLNFKATKPSFTKFDDRFKNYYGLLHFFMNEANGTIETSENSYYINNALTYYDHCFGKIPRNVKWHWLAVQNTDIALASLINYGELPQLYTQTWSNHSWVRLDQNVSFENIKTNRFTSKWKVTSTDLDLVVEPLMYASQIEKIPPLLPFLININHYEFFVKVHGTIRSNNKLIETGDMYGVMEEHHGYW